MLAKLGLILIALLAVASVGDYPVRTPIMASILAIAVFCVLRKAKASEQENATS